MIPRAFKLTPGAITYKGRTFHFWQSRPIDGVIKTAQLVENASGKWFVCFAAEVENKPSSGVGEVGIDLGLKTFATMSDGGKVDIQRTYRRFESDLAIQQRAGNKNRVRAIHQKINAIVAANSVIYVGDVNAAKLAKTRMAKSVLDAGWSMFRNMLAYKSSRAQVHFAIVNERYTSQACSCCGTIPVSSPKGMGALGIRHWTCSDCGTLHDRDVNAARNILRVGAERRAPVVEILAL